MTHRGGLSLNIIIWRIGGGGSFFLPWGPKILLAALPSGIVNRITEILLKMTSNTQNLIHVVLSRKEIITFELSQR
jgi:hypothetical protein